MFINSDTAQPKVEINTGYYTEYNFSKDKNNTVKYMRTLENLKKKVGLL